MAVKGLEDTPWSSWLKHIAARQKFVGFIPDGVILIFQWLNPSGRPMAFLSTQILAEISRGLCLESKDDRCTRLKTLPNLCTHSIEGNVKLRGSPRTAEWLLYLKDRKFFWLSYNLLALSYSLHFAAKERREFLDWSNIGFSRSTAINVDCLLGFF